MGSDRPEKRLQKLIEKFHDLDLKVKLVVKPGANLGIQVDEEDLKLNMADHEKALDIAAGEISDRMAVLFAETLANHIKLTVEQPDTESEDTDDKDTDFPHSKKEVLSHLKSFISKNLGPFRLDDTRIKRLSKKVEMEGKKIRRELGLTDEDVLKLAAISLYNIVFLCDDSASMRMGDRIPALIRTLQSVAEWATRLEPNGVSLRFLNFQGDMDGRFDGLTNQAEIADKIYNVKTGFYTRLGTTLRDKILQHMAGKESPLIVVIITDGEPQGEPKDCLRDSIIDCKSLLEKGGLEGSVVFILFQVGKSAKAQAFLRDLQDDEELEGLVYRSKEPVDSVLRRLKRPLGDVRGEVGKDYKKYKKYLLKEFISAVMGQTEDL